MITVSPTLGSGGSQEKLRVVVPCIVDIKLSGGPGPGVGGKDCNSLHEAKSAVCALVCTHAGVLFVYTYVYVHVCACTVSVYV